MEASFNYKIQGDRLHQDLIDNAQPKTLWQEIFLYLKKLGYEVYSPGQKRDKCINSYIVIKENGTNGQNGNKVGYKLFDIIIYHPISNYSTMEFFVEDVKKDINNISKLRFTGDETPVIIDDKVEAYTTSLEYQALKTLRRRNL